MGVVAQELEGDLPVAMTMAAFVGAAWYICVELNVRLWFSYLRKKGLYFWACVIGTQGVLTQPLLIILADFGKIQNPWVALTLIYISWWMLVIPQSVILYSRLHLVTANPKINSAVLYMIIFTTICISFPTMGLGIAAQSSRIPRLLSANLVWDKVQVTIFFVQETIISILYIINTRRVLQNRATLGQDDKSVRLVMRHLIYTNILVVFLDCSLLAMSYSPFFYVQAAYKPCVYGVKLRVEFSILNRLVQTVRGPTGPVHLGTRWRKTAEISSEGKSSGSTGAVRMDAYTPQSDREMLPHSLHRASMGSLEESGYSNSNTSDSRKGHTTTTTKVAVPTKTKLRTS